MAQSLPTSSTEHEPVESEPLTSRISKRAPRALPGAAKRNLFVCGFVGCPSPLAHRRLAHRLAHRRLHVVTVALHVREVCVHGTGHRWLRDVVVNRLYFGSQIGADRGAAALVLKPIESGVHEPSAEIPAATLELWTQCKKHLLQFLRVVHLVESLERVRDVLGLERLATLLHLRN